MHRLGFLLLLAAALTAQVAPKAIPPKADLPYLQLAEDLIPTESVETQQEAKEKGSKNEVTTYWVAGEHAPAKTPLASPIFIIKQANLALETLSVYPFEIKTGRREISFSRKKQVTGFTITVTKLHEDIYRLEVNESLPAGEYAMTPTDTKQLYCFSVY